MDKEQGGNESEPLQYEVARRKSRKSFKVSNEGVYEIEIDSKQHKVTVIGNVDGEKLVKKLVKTGKTAELWPENSDINSVKSKNKKNKKDPKDKDEENPTDDKTMAEENGNPKKDDNAATAGVVVEDDGREEELAQPNGGEGGGKKKKSKTSSTVQANGDGANVAPVPASSESFPPAKIMSPPVYKANNSPPRKGILPYPRAYYAIPEYGLSYSTTPLPSTGSASGYPYALPMYSYMYSRPYDNYPPPPPSDPIDDHYDDDNVSGCLIM